ncbi:hypothetical protein J7I98_22545 [Streptomyces sp. ISL-98]|uniref:hypothetical protein n=1 Tax=Streptomyces sp. ISL-98 TaxID=2819192 RepID=UPI001BEB429B|nr:hypothetical protein [Streptomyces sp. ISL-98]MBT2508613.1 hypothetical protein [Streptomyces sp. ISL-98]
MRTKKLTTIASIVAAGAFVWALAIPAQAGTQDSGWQLKTAAGTSAGQATSDTTNDNNGNS